MVTYSLNILNYFNNMAKLQYIGLFFLIASGFAFSQPRLEISPDEIEFEDIFNRLENVYLINEGNQPLIIDSIKYKLNLYFIRFDRPALYPFMISPGDSVKMDCILAGYYYVPSTDTLDTLYVYSNSVSGIEEIKVKIDYFDDEPGDGIINGQVTDDVGVVQNAKIYFFYEGNYIIHVTQTDQFGYYSANLPPGSYTVAAEKDSYYVTFYGQKFDPFNAEFIILEDDSIKTAYITLPRFAPTSNSAGGVVYDSLSGSPLFRGIVVVRNSRHNPTKMASNSSGGPVTNGIYTTFVKPNGTYQVSGIIDPDYYFIQSFSDYFIPSYYGSSGYSPPFWQLADSIYIDSPLSSLNIFMPRDSSHGGGNALGSVNINTRADSISDVIIYAQATGSSSLINFSFTSEGGSFNVPFLPYGQYKLIAQKIGYYDGYSSEFTIDINNPSVGNLNIILIPTSAGEEPMLPENILLLHNYPNPFNPSTTIEYYLPESGKIILSVMNILGEEIAVLKDDFAVNGYHQVLFNGDELSSGTYFVLLVTEKGIASRKILLIK
jgi:hypothetical protein